VFKGLTLHVATPNSHSPHFSHHAAATEVYRLDRRTYNNTAAENDLRIATSAIHSGIIPHKFHDSLQLLSHRPALY